MTAVQRRGADGLLTVSTLQRDPEELLARFSSCSFAAQQKNKPAAGPGTGIISMSAPQSRLQIQISQPAETECGSGEGVQRNGYTEKHSVPTGDTTGRPEAVPYLAKQGTASTPTGSGSVSTGSGRSMIAPTVCRISTSFPKSKKDGPPRPFLFLS